MTRRLRARLSTGAGGGLAARGSDGGDRTRSARRGRPLRVLLYSHDTFGLGHLRRNLAIAEHLLQRDPGFEVRLISGSPVVNSWPIPRRLEVSVMPPVVKVGAEQYVARDGSVSFPVIRQQREEVIVRAIRRFQPDVFLVDHSPAGMKGELRRPLSLLRGEFPRTSLMLGLRDILDDGLTVRALWHDQGTYEMIRWAYDRILVYGTEGLFDVSEQYGLPADIRAKLFYCGYIARNGYSVAPPRAGVSGLGGVRRVLVMVGGGGDGFPVVEAYLHALERLTARPARSTIVSGPLMPAEQHLSLERCAARHRGVHIASSTTEMSRLVTEADVIVAMAGYNSTVEILAARKPAIFVPRPAPRAEQRIRAEMLVNMGLAWAVPLNDNAVGALARCLSDALSGARPPCLDDGIIDLEGARRVGDILDTARVRATAWKRRRKPTQAVSGPRAGQVCYLLKRFPRLSETFILNEVRALERLGTDLVIVSLLPREEGLAHATVTEVRAKTYYCPDQWPKLLWAALAPHIALATESPARYLKVAGRALWWGLRCGQPIAALKNFVRAGSVAAICRQHPVRHIHAHFANAPTSVAHHVSMLTGLPFSFTTHAKDLYLTPPRITQRRVAAAQFVLTCTQYNLGFLKRLIDSEHWRKLHLVYHGIDLSAFSGLPEQHPASAGAPTEAVPVILSVGRLVPKKGMKALIEGCALLLQHGVEFECRIVGQGPLQGELQEQIVSLGLVDRVRLMGAMAHDQLIDLYRRATVFALLPQITRDGDRDGIPNVLVEAMAACVPVVSTSVSGIPELVEDHRTGLLVQPQDPVAAAAAIERLLRDSELRGELTSAARRQLRHRFECWESTKAIQALLLAETPP